MSKLSRIRASLDRMDKVLREHPEIRERTAQFFAGELPAMEGDDVAERVQTSLWLEANLLERADALVDRLAASTAGELLGSVTRSDVIRLALKRGIEALEGGIEAPRKRRQRKR